MFRAMSIYFRSEDLRESDQFSHLANVQEPQLISQSKSYYNFL